MTKSPSQNVACTFASRDDTSDLDHEMFLSVLHLSEVSFNSEFETDAYYADLNLDAVIDSIVPSGESDDFLRAQYLKRVDQPTITFRQDIFQDLRNPALLVAIKRFSEQFRQMRVHLSQLAKINNRYYREGWFLDAAHIYCTSVATLYERLGESSVESPGLRSFGEYLGVYVASSDFRALLEDTVGRKKDMAALRYSVRIDAGRVEVRRYENEPDYSEEVLETFGRFKQGAVKDYRIQFRSWPGMDHVGAQILDRVALLFPIEFSALDEYWERHVSFVDPVVSRIERELKFYVSYLDYIAPIEDAGQSFCYPEVSETSKEVYANDTFDLALANKLATEKTAVITNDFFLRDSERVFVISGPNQGGKTTLARTFGQLHHLASIGCPVPGSSARLFLFDHMFTQFEREEDIENQSGKLEDDLKRMHAILKIATPKSIIIMNEAFSSTTLQDARFLGTKVIERILELDLLALYVTFVDEIATLSEKIVSLVSSIVPENPAERTFKVTRGPANGLAYALAIAEKYHVTYEQLRARIDQ